MKTKLVLWFSLMIAAPFAWPVGLTPGIPQPGKSHAVVRKPQARPAVRYRKPVSKRSSSYRKSAGRRYRTTRVYKKPRATFRRTYKRPVRRPSVKPKAIVKPAVSSVALPTQPAVYPSKPIAKPPVTPKPSVSVKEAIPSGVPPSHPTRPAQNASVKSAVSTPKIQKPSVAVAPSVIVVPTQKPATNAYVIKPASNLPSPAVPPASDAKAGSSAQTSSQKPFLEDYEDPKKTELPLGSVLLDLAIKLAVVLGVGYLSLLALKKWMGRAASTATAPVSQRLINVLETSALGTHSSIHLIRVGPKTLLLSATPEQVSVISEIDDAAFADQLASSTLTGSFSTQLNQAMTSPSGRMNEQVKSGVDHLLERIHDIRTLGTKNKADRR